MIDWNRVRDLRAEIGEDDFAEIAALFLAEVDEVMARLQNRADPERLGEDLHSLKGSALNIGFAALSRLCQEGERLASDGRPGDVALKPVFDTYAASRAAFARGLASA